MIESTELERLQQYPRYARRVRLRWADLLSHLPEGLPTRQAMESCLSSLQGDDLCNKLRIVRALVLERLCHLDVSGQADLSDVTQSMTTLAQWALDLLGNAAYDRLVKTHGRPCDEQGRLCPVWTVGMGKLGASELNVSSDIDLVFVYAFEGQTQSAVELDSISNSEFFQRWARSLSQMLSDVNEYGFVFRVDLALRPHGSSGATALSLQALDDYLQESAREWERFAWLKARVVSCVGSQEHAGNFAEQIKIAEHSLQKIIAPFVFRGHLDFAVMQSLRQLLAQIQGHAMQRVSGRSERLDDVKLSPGGIRSLEFVLQLQQIMRGGPWPELRVRSTQEALHALVKTQMMPVQNAKELERAYDFLRRVEHRIQYLDDQQTHYLPREPNDQNWLARCMGFANWHHFETALTKHRQAVERAFEELLGKQNDALPTETVGIRSGAQISETQMQFDAWLEPLDKDLAPQKRLQLQTLLTRCAAWLEQGLITKTALSKHLRWLEHYLRKGTYIAQLYEHSETHLQHLICADSSLWSEQLLLRSPSVIDELSRSALLSDRFDAAQFLQVLHERREQLQRLEQDDEESLMSVLRLAHQREIFRTLLREQKLGLRVEQVSDDLSALADSILQISLNWAWDFIKDRHCARPRVVLIAYGKLGSKELGYGSDLDLVFLYDDTHEAASANFARLLRKLITWLSLLTPQGRVYEIDTALRPNGNSGLLVSSIDAFEDYQTQRGSNSAWVWEHQAMTRARCISASSASMALALRFNQVREHVLCAPRDEKALRDEIVSMRQRMRSAKKPVQTAMPEESFDVKQDTGGMIDLEFAMQFLILLHAGKHPALRHNSGNIALLAAAAHALLLPHELAQDAAQAYRTLRQAQHNAHLNDIAMPLAQTPQLQQARSAVQRLYKFCFEAVLASI